MLLGRDCHPGHSHLLRTQASTHRGLPPCSTLPPHLRCLPTHCTCFGHHIGQVIDQPTQPTGRPTSNYSLEWSLRAIGPAARLLTIIVTSCRRLLRPRSLTRCWLPSSCSTCTRRRSQLHEGRHLTRRQLQPHRRDRLQQQRSLSWTRTMQRQPRMRPDTPTKQVPGAVSNPGPLCSWVSITQQDPAGLRVRRQESGSRDDAQALTDLSGEPQWPGLHTALPVTSR